MNTKQSYILGFLIVFLVLNACTSPSQSMPVPIQTSTLPAGTATPASPTPTPTLTPVPIPEGPCANVLYPILPGNKWVYQTAGLQDQAQMSFKVTGIENDMATFEVIDESAGIATTDKVRCQKGAIENLPLIYISLLLSDYLDGVLNTYQESGVTAPSYQTFEENNWVYSWGVEKWVEQPVEVGIPGLGSGNILESNKIKIQSETTGVREEVNVPAGTFPQAILVSNEMRTPVTIGNSGAILLVKYREWYEPFVGLLKIQTDSASLDYSGVPVPLPVDKSLELVKYETDDQ